MIAVPLRRLSPKTCAAPAAATDLSPRTGAESAAPAAPDLSPGTGRKLALALALVATPACARATTPATTGVVVDPPAPYVTPAGDLVILRHRAAMGMTGAVRAELAPRLDAAPTAAPDQGRDALRAFAIELALLQGDQRAALRELQALSRDLDSLGADATPEERARWHMLHGSCLFAQQRFADARSQSLQALALVDTGPKTALVGDALSALARDQLALGDPLRALASIERALSVHKDILDRFEDRLLTVDIMLALGQPQEAVIAAGLLYDDAILHVGPDTLAHAEALAAVAAATMFSGDRDASRTLFTDARAIFGELQAARSDTDLPVSARLQTRLAALESVHGPAAPQLAPG